MKIKKSVHLQMNDGIYRTARELIAASEREKELIKARMEQETRERHRDAVARYSRTPKGRANNSRKCRKYAEKHRDKMKAYNREWQENFLKSNGVCYSTYRARLRRGMNETEALSADGIRPAAGGEQCPEIDAGIDSSNQSNQSNQGVNNG